MVVQAAANSQTAVGIATLRNCPLSMEGERMLDAIFRFQMPDAVFGLSMLPPPNAMTNALNKSNAPGTNGLRSTPHRTGG